MEINQVLLEKLVTENPEFKKIYDEHSVLKNLVEEMNQRKFLSPEEELKKKNIQKQKLIYKDKLSKILENQKTSTN